MAVPIIEWVIRVGYFIGIGIFIYGYVIRKPYLTHEDEIRSRGKGSRASHKRRSADTLLDEPREVPGEHP